MGAQGGGRRGSAGGLRAHRGGQLTPEDAQALRAVYPEMMADFTRAVAARLPELRKTLPFKHRVALSLFTAIPVDPAMDPRILGALQAQFAGEPGTMGGTQAPTAMPQFGSIKKSPDAPTPAQSRAQGAHV